MRRAERPLADADELDRLMRTTIGAGRRGRVAVGVGEQRAARRARPALPGAARGVRAARRLRHAVRADRRSDESVVDAAKKLASRARSRLHTDPAAQPRRTADHLNVVEAFLTASRGGDIAGLLELLAPEVMRTVDPALVPADVPTTVRGADQVAGETRRFAKRARAGAVMLIDGAPGIVIVAARSRSGPAGDRHRRRRSHPYDRHHRQCRANPSGGAGAAPVADPGESQPRRVSRTSDTGGRGTGYGARPGDTMLDKRFGRRDLLRGAGALSAAALAPWPAGCASERRRAHLLLRGQPGRA